MTKAMRELMAQLTDAENRARDAIANGSAADAEKHMKEVRDLRARVDALRELEAAEEREFEASRPAGEQRDRRELSNEYERVFLKAIRGHGLNADERNVVRNYRREFYNVMHEGGVSGDAAGDSSIVVPVDVETRINELIRAETNLAQYVRTEDVSTLSGTRVLEVGARHTPFQVIGEYDEVPETDNPKFRPISYEVKKYGGFLPMTRELVEDNDANLLAYVERWLGQKVPATYNSLILPILNAITAEDVGTLDDVKRLKNISLIPAFQNRATWFTNQDGFQFLDTLKDTNGRYMLQDDVVAGTGKMLLGRPVVVVENDLWPSVVDGEDAKAPLVLGDLTEYIVHFRRMGYELAITREGGEAWRRDSLELRAILRSDFVTWDDAAVVRGDIVIS